MKVQRRQTLDIADAEGGPTGDSAGRLRYWNEQTQLFKSRCYRGMDAHIPLDGTGGDLMGSIASERRLLPANATLAN